ncbi:MAG: ABC transporter ATP-binding protein [Oscillospiraceae bacterium]|jgi:iron(III) transport system ATP-binding protein|nr:ABC transporter ATP-binding protein [Oscillospiraceae bacterium]
MSTVTIKNLTKSFGSSQVLKEFNEVFRDGEFVTLLGPSGCGKTTMLRMIAGFEIPTTGEIWIDDKLVSGGKTFLPPEKRDIGMVFQSYAVWPHMNVFDNVAYPLQIKHVKREEIRTRVDKILETVHLTRYADRLPNQLSGGQQQRIALARALVAEPNLLLLDEPLSNLDAKLRESMRFEIKDITKSLGISVVYVTHDQTEAMAMSDRIFLINNGIVQQSGTPDEIYNHPANQFVADFLGKVDFFKGVAENGTIHLSEWEADLQYPKMEQSGNIEVAIRPENIRISKESDGIRGKLEKLYYLGDETDCRVRVGKALVRVITDGFSHREFREGDTVTLDVREFIVFPDDGSTQDQLRIRT